MRRLFSTFLMMALLALVGYNTLQVKVLNREIASLEEQVAALSDGDRIISTEASDSIALIHKAQKHADLAKKHLLNKEIDRARIELDKSLQLMQQAGRDTGTGYTEALDRMQRTLHDTRGAIERLWRISDKESGKAKGD